MNKEKRWDTLTTRMMRLQAIARTAWHNNEKNYALKIADTISAIANVRLCYLAGSPFADNIKEVD